MLNSSQPVMESFQELSTILMRISIPYIIIVSLIGFGGNVLTLFMLFKRTFTKNFNNCTLIALALTDLLFNLMLVSRCMNDIIHFNYIYLCRVLAFLSHLAELLSACFTVHFTAQRFVAVRFPLTVIVEKRTYLIHYVIVAIFTLLAILFCLTLVDKNAYDKACGEEIYLIWFISDAFLSFVIPFTTITILNLLIIRHLRRNSKYSQTFLNSQRQWKMKQRTYRRTKSDSASPEVSTHLTNHRRSDEMLSFPASKKNKSNRQCHTELDSNHVNGTSRFLDLTPPIRSSSIRSTTTRSISQSHRVTRMLILVSTCFLLLNAPSHICTIGMKIYMSRPSPLSSFSRVESSDSNNRTIIMNIDSSNPSINIQFLYIAVVVTQHIAYASYSINFFLYSFCGMKFRRELARWFFCRTRLSKHQININRSLQLQSSV